jgi:hypothetical protein
MVAAIAVTSHRPRTTIEEEIAMAEATGSKRSSRRALLGAAAGATAATIVGAVARPLPTQALTQSLTLTNDENGSTVITGRSVVQGGFPNSGQGTGVHGATASGYGVYGTANSGTGVWGESNSGVGLHAVSTSSFGVYGYSASGIAVHGASFSGTMPAIQGWAKSGRTAIVGYSGVSSPPAGPANTGVYGFADNGTGSIGVLGRSSTGRGGAFSGKLAQLHIAPSARPSHPASGQLGDIFLDSNKRLWFCKGGTTWSQIV